MIMTTWKVLDLTSKLDIWIFHVFMKKYLYRPVEVCDLLIKGQEKDAFLKRIITEDEKWVLYGITMSNASDHEVKKMNRVKAFRKPIFAKTRWRYLFGGISNELLSDNTTINSKVYYNQLGKVNDSLKQKRLGLINWKGVVLQITLDFIQVW